MAETISKPSVDREKTAPFLVRTFVKIGGFHRTNLFEDGNPPTVDEHQLFTWKDATLSELLVNLRALASPTTPEFRHPLAKYQFRALFVDPQNRALYQSKDIGTVYSRDLADPDVLLKEPDENGGAQNVEATKKSEVGAAETEGGMDVDHPSGTNGDATNDTKAPEAASASADHEKDREREDRQRREREERTLEELRFVPGDFLSVAVILPKHSGLSGAGRSVNPAVSSATTGRNGPGLSIKGASQWSKPGDSGWGTKEVAAPPGGLGRGGGHWRGRATPAGAPAGVGRGEAAAGRGRERDVGAGPGPGRRGDDGPPSRRGESDRGRGGPPFGGGGGRRDERDHDKRPSPPHRRDRRSPSPSAPRRRSPSPAARRRSTSPAGRRRSPSPAPRRPSPRRGGTGTRRSPSPPPPRRGGGRRSPSPRRRRTPEPNPKRRGSRYDDTR